MSVNPDILPFPGRPTVVAAKPPGVVIVSCDQAQAQRLSLELQAYGEDVEVCDSLQAAQCVGELSDVCVIGALPPGESIMNMVEFVEQRGSNCHLIALCQETAALANSTCATCLPETSPADLLHSLVVSARQRLTLQRENRRLKRQLTQRLSRDLAGHSSSMQTVRQQVLAVSDNDSAVLICGPEGTPVESVAHSIHDSSLRGQRPFVRIDCRLLSAESLEQALWGELLQNWQGGQQHEGPGRLEMAAGGTVFLEAIESVALPVQKRLVSLVSQKKLEHPLTGNLHRFDVRVVCSSSADLQGLAGRGLFRPELLEALQVSPTLVLNSIAERKDDLAVLTENMLRRIALSEGRPVRSMTVEALRVLQGYQWPGNDCELESTLQQVCSIDTGTRLTAAMVQPWIGKTIDDNQALPMAGLMTLHEMERRLIETTFVRFEGNRERTAKALQIGIRTLCGKLREYGYPPRGGPGSNRVTAPQKLAPASIGFSDLRAA